MAAGTVQQQLCGVEVTALPSSMLWACVGCGAYYGHTTSRQRKVPTNWFLLPRETCSTQKSSSQTMRWACWTRAMTMDKITPAHTFIFNIAQINHYYLVETRSMSQTQVLWFLESATQDWHCTIQPVGNVYRGLSVVPDEEVTGTLRDTTDPWSKWMTSMRRVLGAPQSSSGISFCLRWPCCPLSWRAH